MSQGTYALGTIEFDIAVAVTNTTPTGAYRAPDGQKRRHWSSGRSTRRRSNSASIRSRSAAELPRRRRFVHDDHGQHLRHRPVRSCWAAAEVTHGAEQRNGALATPAPRHGVASYYVEISGLGCRRVRRHRGPRRGAATVFAGTLSHGQGTRRRTMLVSDQTGIPTTGSRCRRHRPIRTGGGTGTALAAARRVGRARATEAMVDSAKELAARPLEADVADIVVDTPPAPSESPGAGTGVVVGGPRDTPRRTARHSPVSLTSNRTAPPSFGAHIAVSRSTRTRARSALRHGVDDCGTVLNPCSSKVSSTAVSRRGSDRRCSRRSATTPTATPSPRTSPSTRPCRQPNCRRSRPIRRRHRLNPLGRRDRGAPRSVRPPPCRTQIDASPTSAGTSTCRAHPSGCGRPSTRRATARCRIRGGAAGVFARLKQAGCRRPRRAPTTSGATGNGI